MKRQIVRVCVFSGYRDTTRTRLGYDVRRHVHKLPDAGLLRGARRLQGRLRAGGGLVPSDRRSGARCGETAASEVRAPRRHVLLFCSGSPRASLTLRLCFARVARVCVWRSAAAPAWSRRFWPRWSDLPPSTCEWPSPRVGSDRGQASSLRFPFVLQLHRRESCGGAVHGAHGLQQQGLTAAAHHRPGTRV